MQLLFAFKPLQQHMMIVNVVVLSFILIGCSKSDSTGTGASEEASDHNAIVRIDGSSTVFPVTEAVAEEFQIKTKTKVTVGVSGTGGGFKKFCRGETDISNASRPILHQEIEDCKAAGIAFIELPVAYDALTVVINPKNTFAKTMTVAELKKMWEPSAQESIKNWNQINPSWPDAPLKLFGPGADSGTFDYFTEVVVGKSKSSRGDFTASEDDNVLVQGIAGDMNGMGYFGYAYYEENKDKLTAVAIKAAADKPAVLPSAQTIEDGTYQPLARPIFIYVNANSASTKPYVKEFVDFYLAESRMLIEEVKYVPFPEADQAAILTHWENRITGTAFNEHAGAGLKIGERLKKVN
jgi:phosphate transport system substrate-binding protein